MITERNVTYLYVGNVASGAGNGAKLNLDAMPNGSVAVVNVANDTAISGVAMTAGVEYQVVNKLSDGTIVRSPKTRLSQIKAGGRFTHETPKEQVSYLGYNGSAFSGLGTIVQGNDYIVSIWLNNTKGVYSAESEKKIFSAKASTATQLDLVNDLVKSASAALNGPHASSKMIAVERAAAVTGVDATAGDAVVLKFTNGSKTVTFHTNAGVASTGTITEGALVSVPSWTANTFTITCANNTAVKVIIDGKVYDAATEATAAAVATNLVTALESCPVVTASANAGVVTIKYIAGYVGLPPATAATTAITGGASASSIYVAATGATAGASFELDVPWEGPTGYAYTKATVSTGVGVATVTANTYGLKFSGVPQPFSPQTGYPVQVSFDVLTDSFGSISEYKAQSANPGAGDWKGLAELEAYAQGNEVWYRNSAYPTPNYRREIKKGTGYNVITLAIQNDVMVASTTGTTVGNPYTITIATKSTLSNYDGLGSLLP